MTDPIFTDAEATTRLYILHNAILTALRDKRYGDCLELSQQAVEQHLKLQQYLRQLN